MRQKTGPSAEELRDSRGVALRPAASGRRFNVVELYAGTARSWEAFRRWRRCRLALLVDNDRNAEQAYLANYPRAPYYRGDLASLTPGHIRFLAGGQVDILLGCPPCQGFSESGTRDPDDPRNAHLGRFIDIAMDLQPLVVCMENVPAMVGVPAFKAATDRLEAAGYRWTAGIVNAALWGSAQSRHRLILVAAHKKTKAEPHFPEKPTHGGSRAYFNYGTHRMVSLKSDPVTMLGLCPAAARYRAVLPYQESGLGTRPVPYLEEAMSGLPAVGSSAARVMSHRGWAHKAAMRERMEGVPEGGRWLGGTDHYSHSYGRLHRQGLARTITTFFANPGSGRYWHPTEERTLTLREAARLQGFPDDFDFRAVDPSKAAVLVGNALDSALARITYRIARGCLE